MIDVLEHPLVANYLHDLDAALACLPAAGRRSSGAVRATPGAPAGSAAARCRCPAARRIRRRRDRGLRSRGQGILPEPAAGELTSGRRPASPAAQPRPDH
jgi:hypothetical protein